MGNPEKEFAFNFSEDVSLSIPESCAEGFRNRIIHLIFQDPQDTISDIENKKRSDAPKDLMTDKYISSWTEFYISKMKSEQLENNNYSYFFYGMLLQMDDSIFLKNQEKLLKLCDNPFLKTIITAKKNLIEARSSDNYNESIVKGLEEIIQINPFS
ncbi:hypothetical protein [Tenacibaculum xiamenense]|uniref:hypothetical protein n=1 Tax=Tenacibaculum xiamenense TaxID=1261553 RepID=UPI00389467CC